MTENLDRPIKLLGERQKKVIYYWYMSRKQSQARINAAPTQAQELKQMKKM